MKRKDKYIGWFQYYFVYSLVYLSIKEYLYVIRNEVFVSFYEQDYSFLMFNLKWLLLDGIQFEFKCIFN